MTTNASVDSITLEIIASALQATGDEMFAVLRRAAMSAIIYEVLDAGTAITGPDGDLVSSGAGIPTFVAVLDRAVKCICGLYSPCEIRPGDVFLSNDPSYGGVTHLNDVVIALPVFVGDELVAWTANVAHWNDVGGSAPGSVTTRATDIFQEGLRIPAIKVIDGGVPVRGVLDILQANGRLPEFLYGDLWAGVAAARVGERRIAELVRRYGRCSFDQAIAREIAYGEEVARRRLRELPRGRFELEEEQDDGSVYAVAIEIGDGELLVDLTRNPDECAGPTNLSRDGATIAAQMVLMNVIGLQGSANAGHLRPLTVLTRRGSMFDPHETAACGLYYETRMALYDLLLRCLAVSLKERLPAGSFASICGTFIGGRHPDTGRHFTIVEPEVGGWGASSDHDGNSALFSPVHGDTFNCPAEVAEGRYGLFVEQLALSGAPGGAGRQRGGRGITLEYRVRNDGCFLTCAYRRGRHPPWSLAGGYPGSCNYVEILRDDGSLESYCAVTALPLYAGDVIRIHTGHGGGFGDPRERPRRRVLEDVRDGYVSAAEAHEIYGVAI